MNKRMMIAPLAGAALSWMAVSLPSPVTAAAPPQGSISERKLAQIVPGKSTRAKVQSILGPPWRVVQFNDCGAAMPDQADETWDYRGKDANGTYRVHIEFDDNGVTHLVAKIPDYVTGGKGTTAKVAPAGAMKSMPM
ncbi:MAG TPA: outer membrane protein assembly factor BamE [Steroidobacteraceae bacterium]|nr:outer membrane protein assembly factor BamE [Steroidobacteraceae bacterium]